MRYIFDACAIIAFFNNEPGADVVRNLLSDANEGYCEVVMTRYNLLEAYYGFLRDFGAETAESILTLVRVSSIKTTDMLNDDLLRQAGRFKVAYHISLADAVVLAQAAIDDAIVVTSDHHELDAVERDGKIKFLWIR